MGKNRMTADIKMNILASIQNSNQVIQSIDKIAKHFDFGDRINSKFADAKKDLVQLSKAMERISYKNVVSNEDMNNLNKMSSTMTKTIGNVSKLYGDLNAKGLKQFSREYITEMKRINEATEKLKQSYFENTGKSYDKESKKVESLTHQLKELHKTKEKISSQEHKKSLVSVAQNQAIEELKKQIELERQLSRVKKDVDDKEKSSKRLYAREKGYESYSKLSSIANGDKIKQSESEQKDLVTKLNKIKSAQSNVQRIQKAEKNNEKQTAMIVNELLKINLIEDNRIDRQQALNLLQQEYTQTLKKISTEETHITEQKRQQKRAKEDLDYVNKRTGGDTKAVVATAGIGNIKTVSALSKKIIDNKALVAELTKQSQGEMPESIIGHIEDIIRQEQEGVDQKIEEIAKELEPLQKIAQQIAEIDKSKKDVIKNTEDRKVNIPIDSKKESLKKEISVKSSKLNKDKKAIDDIFANGVMGGQKKTSIQNGTALQDFHRVLNQTVNQQLDENEASKRLQQAKENYRKALEKELQTKGMYYTEPQKQEIRNRGLITSEAIYNRGLAYTKDSNELRKKQREYGNVNKQPKKEAPIINNFDEKISRASESAGQLAVKLEKSTAQSKFIGSAFTDIGNKLNYVLSLNFALDRIFEQFHRAVSYVRELDQDMTQIGLVLEQTSSKVWKNFNTYSKMATRLNTTTSDIVGAMKLFYQQGLDTSEVNKMVEASAIAAALGESTMAEASETLTSIINSYNLNANQAINVTDKISSVAIESAADFGEMSTAIEKVASSAASAGLDLDHMMGYLAKAIETTREAPTNIGTALKTIVANFSKFKEDPSALTAEGTSVNDVDEALATVGIHLLDAQGNMRDLGDVIDDLGQKWDGLDRNTKAYLATTIAGTRQQSRFYAIMNDYDRTMELVKTSTNSAGQSTKLFNIYQKSFTASTKRLRNEIEKLYASFTSGEGILRKLTDGFANLLGIINKIPLALSGIMGLGAIAGGRGIVNWFSSFNNALAESKNALLSLEGLTKDNVLDKIAGSTGNSFAQQGLSPKLAKKAGRAGGALINKLTHTDEAVDKYNELNKVVTELNKVSLKEGEIRKVVAKQLTYEGEQISRVIKKGDQLILVKKGEQAATADLTLAKVADEMETQKAIATGKVNVTVTWAQVAAKAAYIAIIAAGALALWGLNKATQAALNAENKRMEVLKKTSNEAQEQLKTNKALIEEYIELNDKMILTNEERERMAELRDQIVAQNKELVAGYDSEGNAILKNSAALKEHLKILEQEADQKEQNVAQAMMGQEYNDAKGAMAVGAQTAGGAAIGALTGAGLAVAGAKLGAVIGTAAGPGIGTAVGAAVGAVIGGGIGLISGLKNNSDAKAGMSSISAYSNTSWIWGSSQKKEGTFANDKLQDQAQRIYALMDSWGGTPGDAKTETMLAEGKYDDAIKRARKEGQDLLAKEIETYKGMATQAYADMVYSSDAVNIGKSNLGAQKDAFLQDFISKQVETLIGEQKNEEEIKEYFSGAEWKTKYDNYLNGLKGMTDEQMLAYDNVISNINSGDFSVYNLEHQIASLDDELQSQATEVLKGYTQQIKDALSKLKVGNQPIFSDLDLKTYDLNSLQKIASAYNEMTEEEREHMAKGLDQLKKSGRFDAFLSELNDLDQTSKSETNIFKNKWKDFWVGNEKSLDGLINYTKRTVTQLGDDIANHYSQITGKGKTKEGIKYGDIYGGNIDEAELLKILATSKNVDSLYVSGNSLGMDGHMVWESIEEARGKVIDDLLEIEQNSWNKMQASKKEIEKVFDSVKGYEKIDIRKFITSTHRDKSTEKKKDLSIEAYGRLSKGQKEIIEANKEIIEQEQKRYDLAKRRRKEEQKESAEHRGIRTNQYMIGGIAEVNKMASSLENLSSVYEKLNNGSMTQLEIIQMLAQDTSGELLSALDVENGKLTINKKAIETLAETRKQAAIDKIDSQINEIDAEISALKANTETSVEIQTNAQETKEAQKDLGDTVKNTSIEMAENFSSSTESQINDINQLLSHLEQLRKGYEEVKKAEKGEKSKGVEKGKKYDKTKVSNAVEPSKGQSGSPKMTQEQKTTMNRVITTALGYDPIFGSSDPSFVLEQGRGPLQIPKTNPFGSNQDINSRNKTTFISKEQKIKELMDERERLVALRDGIAKMSAKNLLNTISDLKDKGSGFDSTVEHLEKFYVYLRGIEAIERKLVNLQAKQAQLDLTNSYDLSLLSKENELLHDKYSILQKMIPEQKVYLDLLKNKLEKQYSQWIFFDNAGNLNLRQTDIKINSEKEQKKYDEFDRLKTEYETQLQSYDDNKVSLLEIQNTIIENINTKYEKQTKQLEDQKAALEKIVALEEHRKELSFRDVFALRYYESILQGLQKSYDTQNQSYKNAISQLRILDQSLRDPDLSKWVEFNEITQEWGYSANFAKDLEEEDSALMAQLANVQSMVSEYEKLHGLSETLKQNVQEVESTIKSTVEGALSGYTDALSKVVEQNDKILSLYEESLDILKKENDLYEGDTSNLQKYYDTVIEGAMASKYAMQEYQKKATETIDSILNKYGQYVTEVNGMYAINDTIAKEQLTTDEIVKLEQSLILYNNMNEAAKNSQDQFYDYMNTIKELEETKRDAIIDVMQQVHDELTELDQKDLDDLQKKYDEMNRLDSEYYSSLSQKVSDARKKRDQQQTTQKTAQLQNQISILERDSSGAYSTQLRDLRNQLAQALQTQADTNVDNELERIQREQEERQKDREIEIAQMENLISFKTETGAYWDQAYDLWESGRASVESFLASMYERQGLSKEELSKKISEMNQNLDNAWVKYGNINAQAIGTTVSPIAENLRQLTAEVSPNVITGIQTNISAIETADKNITAALQDIEKAIQEIYSLEDKNPIIDEMIKNSNQWQNASAEKRAELNETNKALGESAGLHYDPTTGLYYDKYGQAAYNGNDKNQYNSQYDIAGMQQASAKMQANGKKWRADMTPQEKQALHNKNAQLAAPYGWYYDSATGVWYTDRTKRVRVYDKYEHGGYVKYTGIAQVDGTSSRPEAFLNAQQTKLFEQLRDSLAGKKGRNTTGNNGTSGDNIIINNLEISVKELADTNSIDKVVKTVKQSIYKDATSQTGITRVTRR